MNTNTSEFLKKWGGLIVTLVLLILATLFIQHTGKPKAITTSDTATLTPGLMMASTTDAAPIVTTNSSGEQTGAIITQVTPNATYMNPSWSIKFTVRGDWAVNMIPDSTGALHQLQLSGMKNVVFISKNEAIGLSSDLAYTTSMRTIHGQSVSVRTYSHPNAQFASYQLFSLKESDGTYAFLIKNVSDTNQTDSFINSISDK